MFAALSVTGSAQVVVNPDTFPDFFTSGDVGENSCYFASVSNGEDFGLGASQTSITVQNLDDEAGVIYIWTGSGDGFEEAAFAVLNPGASKTFTGADLGVAEGTTVPVIVSGYDDASSQAGEFTPEDGIVIGCVAKQAVTGATLPYTTGEDTSVSGYNATSGREVGFFDELYLPIVQTNCGPGGCWDTILRVANVGPFDNAAVTVRFFPASDGSGSLQEGFQLQALLNQGELWSIDLMDWVPEGWVGSAHILTDDNVVAIADRFKAGTDMWITNTAANKTAESNLQIPGGPSNAPYVLFAPDVRFDYNGWNLGASVANTVDADNNVNIQYFGNNGNAPQAQSMRLAAHGMDYFYNPSDPSEDDCEQPADQVVTCDFVGAAIVLSEHPVAVAVDNVKYFGNDATVGHAYSYSATGNVFQLQAAPLVQKGSPATGMGATSGITFLNPNAGATFITVDWVNPSGFLASNFGDTVVWVPGFATGFVYTMFQENLPNGFLGSALVASELPIAATSANVDYQVQGDGAMVYTLYNPCGLYRQIGECEFIAPIPTATKIIDTNVEGALVCIYAVGDAGQDGKPELPTECEILAVGVKGGEAPGQGEATTYFADLGDEGDVADITFDEETNELDATFYVNGDGEEGVTYTASIFNDVEDENPDDMSDDTIASGENAVCPPSGVIDTAFLGENETVIGSTTADADGDLTISGGGTLTSEEVEDLGDLTNAVAVVYDEVTGEIIACGQIEAGTVEFESFADAAVRLGAEAVGETDADGDFEVELPLGDYVAIVTADGFVTATEEFTLDEEGEVEVNEVDLTAIVAPEMGVLTKALDIPDDVIVTSIASEIWFCSGDLADSPDSCDDLDDPAVVSHGGYDDVVNDNWDFEFSHDVPVGTYTICSIVEVTADWDADPLTPDTTISTGFICESSADISVGEIGHGPVFDGEIEPIAVEDGLETYVENVFASLDVFVRDDETDLPIAGADVCVFVDGDLASEPICTTTDVTGFARFFGIPDGTHLVAVSAENYEAEASVAVDYNLAADLVDSGVDLTEATADQVVALDPAIGGIGVVDAQLDIVVDDQVVSGRNFVEVYIADAADVAGINGSCNGALVLSGTTSLASGTDVGLDDIDEITFGVNSAQSYCVIAYAGDTFGVLLTADVAIGVTITAGDPPGDLDLTLNPV